MTCPGNGIYVVQGEMAILLTAMRRGARWSSHSHQDDEQDSLIRSFTDLKDVLNQLGDLRELDANHFLGPFLEVIRSEETTGPVTSLALSAVNKFLSYGLIDPAGKSVAATVENIADAVTHARFVGTDQTSDGVVLMKILQVLRTLMLSPEGTMLTNESVCEIMLSCFRICFESRLTELLRRSAEHCLKDMVQLLFSRLPQFSEDVRLPLNIKKLKMRTGGMDPSRGKRKSRTSQRNKSNRSVQKPDDGQKITPNNKPQEELTNPVEKIVAASCDTHLATTPLTPGGNIVDMQGTIHQGSLSDEPGQIKQDDSAPCSLADQTETTEQPIRKVSQERSQSQSNIDQLEVAETDSDAVQKSVQGDGIEISEAVNEFPGQSISDSRVVTNQVETSSESAGQVTQDDSATDPVSSLKKPMEQHSSIDTSQVSASTVINLDGDYGEGDASSVLSSKTCSVEDVSLSGVQDDSYTKSNEEEEKQEYVNPRGVRFMSQEIGQDGSQPLVPYGVVCVRELFRFLISLCNPLDKQNNESMIHMGLTLLTVALEIGADSIGKYNSLLSLVKDELCRNLFSLLNMERLSIFAADLQVSFLLFEALRTHLKFQLEFYLTKVIDIIISDSPKITYEQKEIALESVVQLWRIPGFVTELYLNYDCDLYCPNLFEDLTKLLSKNAFPVSGLYNTHLLSLDALLTIIDSIEGHCHSRIVNERQDRTDGITIKDPEKDAVPIPRAGRLRVSDSIPTHEQLMAVKRKKKLLATGSEQFNSKPKKGIQFLQDHHLFSTPLDPHEVIHFLRENPRLDKKMIGEYISNRNNLEILDAFVKSFDFTDTRIDDALRQYLETFRLPGEAPLISLIMEQFAEHWHKQNGEPFADADAAFTLAYAVIMLNVDQHNHNVKRQSVPMTCDEFKRNLKKVNGGEDFDQELLDDIYNSIKNDEIVMPAEQTGLVRENYLWKVLLRRGASKDGIFIHAPNGLFDHDLFSLIWGPTVAALSFIFDKSSDATIYQKAISGFRKCAMISAHYGMSNDFDNLVISLCKFTNLLNTADTPENLTISFGSNPKAQLAAKTVFNLAHRHGDILREGWKNVLDSMLQLYRCKLLPKVMVEAEDFIEPSGKISLMREEAPSQKTETGLLSSIYSYIALASEPSSQKVPSPEDQEYIQRAHACVQECHLEHLINESKFLRIDSLQELVKALIFASHGPESHISSGMSYDEDAAVFFLELLIKVVIQNRDRVNAIWMPVRDHMYRLVMGSAACDHHFLMERSIVGLLRLAIRLMRREDMSPMVLQSLRMLLLLKSGMLARVARQIAYGLYELLKTSAANIHSDTDWSIIFTLLECVGAGAHPPRVVSDNSREASDQAAKSDGDVPQEEDSGLGNERGYTSDSELSKATTRQHSALTSRPTSPELSPNSGGGWILVGREGEIQPLTIRPLPVNQFSIVHERELLPHDPYALVKCCESLAFLVRDVAHITPYNFENCVHCIRTFVEASLNGNDKRGVKKSPGAHRETKGRKKPVNKRRDERARSPPNSNNPYDADESDSEELPGGYLQVSIQLLDLMHTLHTRTAQIFRWWAEENGETEFTSLWAQGWCPLLKGIARLCCDSRRQVRMSAITYLQRALLVHDLQTLTASEWESCFNNVLFPLLAKLLEPISPQDLNGMEETRMRAATVLSKVFLHHLTPLLSLPTFTALWLTILEFMDKYMHADKSDLLYEAIPESLKNMLLVMDSARIFSSSDGYSQLWTITWDRINVFLPTLKEELFKSHPAVEASQNRMMAETSGNTSPVTTPQSPSPPPMPMEPALATPLPTLSAGTPSSIPVTMPTSATPMPLPTPSAPVPVSMPVSSVSHMPVSTSATPVPVATPPAAVPMQMPAAPPVAPSTSVPLSLSASPPATCRSTSIILQPPARNVSTPIFTHLGQQMLSTSIGPPPASMESHQPVLYTQPMTLYSQPQSQPAEQSVPCATTAAGVMIPSHYFGQDVGQQQLFPVSVPTSGTSPPNLFLLNPNIIEGANIPTLPILSPPGGVNDST